MAFGVYVLCATYEKQVGIILGVISFFVVAVLYILSAYQLIVCYNHTKSYKTVSLAFRRMTCRLSRRTMITLVFVSLCCYFFPFIVDAEESRLRDLQHRQCGHPLRNGYGNDGIAFLLL